MSNAKALFFKVCRCVYFLWWCCKYPKSFCLIECTSPGVVYYSASFAQYKSPSKTSRFLPSRENEDFFLESLNNAILLKQFQKRLSRGHVLSTSKQNLYEIFSV